MRNWSIVSCLIARIWPGTVYLRNCLTPINGVHYDPTRFSSFSTKIYCIPDGVAFRTLSLGWLVKTRHTSHVTRVCFPLFREEFGFILNFFNFKLFFPFQSHHVSVNNCRRFRSGGSVIFKAEKDLNFRGKEN